MTVARARTPDQQVAAWAEAIAKNWGPEAPALRRDLAKQGLVLKLERGALVVDAAPGFADVLTDPELRKLVALRRHDLEAELRGERHEGVRLGPHGSKATIGPGAGRGLSLDEPAYDHWSPSGGWYF